MEHKGRVSVGASLDGERFFFFLSKYPIYDARPLTDCVIDEELTIALKNYIYDSVDIGAPSLHHVPAIPPFCVTAVNHASTTSRRGTPFRLLLECVGGRVLNNSLHYRIEQK